MDKLLLKYFAGLVTLFVTITFVWGKDMTSIFPEFSSSERILNSQEIEELPCTVTVRNDASKYGMIIWESEFVTQDEKLGYVYRYDFVNNIVDDASFHPEIGTKGTVSEIKSRLVVHSTDCIHFTFVVGVDSIDGRKL